MSFEIICECAHTHTHKQKEGIINIQKDLVLNLKRKEKRVEIFYLKTQSNMCVCVYIQYIRWRNIQKI